MEEQFRPQFDSPEQIREYLKVPKIDQIEHPLAQQKISDLQKLWPIIFSDDLEKSQIDLEERIDDDTDPLAEIVKLSGRDQLVEALQGFLREKITIAAFFDEVLENHKLIYPNSPYFESMSEKQKQLATIIGTFIDDVRRTKEGDTNTLTHQMIALRNWEIKIREVWRQAFQTSEYAIQAFLLNNPASFKHHALVFDSLSDEDSNPLLRVIVPQHMTIEPVDVDTPIDIYSLPVDDADNLLISAYPQEENPSQNDTQLKEALTRIDLPEQTMTTTQKEAIRQAINRSLLYGRLFGHSNSGDYSDTDDATFTINQYHRLVQHIATKLYKTKSE